MKNRLTDQGLNALHDAADRVRKNTVMVPVPRELLLALLEDHAEALAELSWPVVDRAAAAVQHHAPVPAQSQMAMEV